MAGAAVQCGPGPFSGRAYANGATRQTVLYQVCNSWNMAACLEAAAERLGHEAMALEPGFHVGGNLARAPGGLVQQHQHRFGGAEAAFADEQALPDADRAPPDLAHRRADIHFVRPVRLA